MLPLEFDGCNVVYGKNQPEYMPLPAEKRMGKSGEVVTCWELSEDEKKIIQETGKIWISMLTFGGKLMPILPAVIKPVPYDE